MTLVIPIHSNNQIKLIKVLLCNLTGSMPRNVKTMFLCTPLTSRVRAFSRMVIACGCWVHCDVVGLTCHFEIVTHHTFCKGWSTDISQANKQNGRHEKESISKYSLSSNHVLFEYYFPKHYSCNSQLYTAHTYGIRSPKGHSATLPLLSVQHRKRPNYGHSHADLTCSHKEE